MFKRIAQGAIKYLKLRKGSNAITEIAKRINPSGSRGTDLEITGIFANSKEVKDRSLFVAVKGVKADGSGFVAEALKNGAVCVAAGRYQPGP